MDDNWSYAGPPGWANRGTSFLCDPSCRLDTGKSCHESRRIGAARQPRHHERVPSLRTLHRKTRTCGGSKLCGRRMVRLILGQSDPSSGLSGRSHAALQLRAGHRHRRGRFVNCEPWMSVENPVHYNRGRHINSPLLWRRRGYPGEQYFACRFDQRCNFTRRALKGIPSKLLSSRRRPLISSRKLGVLAWSGV